MRAAPRPPPPESGAQVVRVREVALQAVGPAPAVLPPASAQASPLAPPRRAQAPGAVFPPWRRLRRCRVHPSRAGLGERCEVRVRV